MVQDFKALPKHADAGASEEQRELCHGIYREIYAGLARHHHALPVKAPEAITRPELLAHLRKLCGDAVRAAIAADPGRFKESPEVIAGLLNTSEGVGTIWNAIPHAPNVLTAEDVVAILKGP